MISVDSSVISAIDYSHDYEQLTIEFNNGSTYEYYNVPLSVWEGLKGASSKGRYFNAEILGVYKFSKV